MIDNLFIKNLRSFKGEYDIPLAKFNLLYGNNGSGKSSIIEAIGLCITGYTERYEKNIVNEIKSRGAEDLAIKIAKEDNILSEFNSYDLKIAYKTLLKKYYDIDEHHLSAKNILRTLFSTHNILAQEDIIRLLDANNREDFMEAIKRNIAGQELHKTAQKLDIFSVKLDKLSPKLKKEQGDIESQIASLKAKIRELNSGLDSNFTDTALGISEKATSSNISAIMKPIEASHDALRHWINEQRNLFSQIKITAKSIEENPLNEEEISIDSITSLVNKHKQNAKIIEDEISKTKTIIHSLEGELKTAKENQIKLQDKLNTLSPNSENIMNEVNDINYLNDWRGELRAYLACIQLKEDRTHTQKQLDIYKEATNILNTLPSLEIYESTVKSFELTSKSINKQEVEKSSISGAISNIDKELTSINTELSVWQNNLSKNLKDYEQLHQMSYQLLHDQDNSECPLCAHNYKSKESLLKAIEDNINSIRNKTQSHVPKRLNEQNQLNTKRNELEKQLNELSLYLDNNKKLLDENSIKISKWDNSVDTVVILFTNQNLLNLDDVNNAESNVSKICLIKGVEYKSHEMKLKKALESFQTKESKEWLGLSQDDFSSHADRLLDIYSQLDDKSIYHNDEKWNKHLSAADERKKESDKDKNKLTNSIQTNQNKIESFENKVKMNNSHLATKSEKLGRDQLYIAKTDAFVGDLKLLHGYLIKASDSINIKLIKSTINNLLSELDSFEISINNQEKAQKATEQYNIEINKHEQSISKIQIKINKLEKLRAQVGKISKLDTHINKQFTKYLDNINSLFKRLHQPPDYEKIVLSGDENSFDIRIKPKYYEDLQYPLVLSSGQRAALAISMFLTYNLYGRKSPKIILMDEPIQQVDDLNSLNFLDVLRWIIEGSDSDRQIVISTANSKVAALIKRKFSYLGENYNEIHIDKKFAQSSYVSFYDSTGNQFYPDGFKQEIA